MKFPTWLTVVLSVLLLILFPIVFGQVMVASLNKLHLGEGVAAPLVAAIIFGGLVNIPLQKPNPAYQDMLMHPLAAYGLPVSWPRMTRPILRPIIAVNLGGCVIPASLAAYELIQIAGTTAVAAAFFATVVNTLICYWIARPVPGLGIVMPGYVSPLVAAALALVLAPGNAPAVAFISGVIGPLIGADLFHLHDFTKSGTGMASIGGAGTFDGIVLSGIVAAYLA